MDANAPDLTVLRQNAHWSFSSLNCILNICSLQWAFGHVLDAEPAFTPVSLAFGIAFHRAAAEAATARMDGEPLDAGALPELFAACWDRARRDAAPDIRYDVDTGPEDLLARGQRMLAVLMESWSPAETVTAVSRAFSVPLPGVETPLIGEFDCVVDLDGLTVIVDWKTAGSRWPADRAHRDLQPTAYLHAARHLGADRAVAFRFDVVTKGKTPAVERRWTTRGPDDFARLGRLAAVAEGIVRHGLFVPAEQGWYCKTCPYRAPCRAWHRRAATTVSIAA